MKEYEKICGMFAGVTPPPWSRMRMQSTAGCKFDVGGGAIVSWTGGMGSFEEVPCWR